MATYVISDIHGEYDMFLDLLEKIELKEADTLYILGDVLDRGPHPVKVLLKLMEMPNVICLAGNHELMALECLTFLRKEITDMSIEELDEEMLDNLVTWQCNGGWTTIDEFRTLNRETQQDVIEYIREFLLYEELTINGRSRSRKTPGQAAYTGQIIISRLTAGPAFRAGGLRRYALIQEKNFIPWRKTKAGDKRTADGHSGKFRTGWR